MDKTSDGTENLRFRPNRTFICSVVFLDIVEYSKKPVEEQIRLKEHFNVILSEAIRDIAVNDRIMIDTGDGAAIGFLGDPEDALFVAMSFQEATVNEITANAPSLSVRIGINLGPVKLLKDINKQLNLIGDGINVAQRIMSFAEPDQLMVSRSFYDVVSCLSQEYARLFQYQGARADKHVREHDIYLVEHSGIRPIPAHQRHDKQKNISIAESADVTAEKPQERKISTAAAAAASEHTRGFNAKKWLSLGVPILAVIIGLAVFVPRGKVPQERARETAAIEKKDIKSSQSPTASIADVPAPDISKQEATSAAAPSKPTIAPFRAVSSRADDIVFTFTGLKKTDGKIICAVNIHNKSKVDKSVALYDDAFRWTKSKLTDDAGKIQHVSNVTFTKGSQKVAMSASGTRGIIIGPGETVAASMTFKKESLRQVRSLDLHPFIYEGRRWQEHDLVLKLSH
jgi:hypothetical protein